MLFGEQLSQCSVWGCLRVGVPPCGSPPREGASMWGLLGLLAEWELWAQVEAWMFTDSSNNMHPSTAVLGLS